jgi:hypothetical protein
VFVKHLQVAVVLTGRRQDAQRMFLIVANVRHIGGVLADLPVMLVIIGAPLHVRVDNLLAINNNTLF